MFFPTSTKPRPGIDSAGEPSLLPSRFDAAGCAEGAAATQAQREQIERSLQRTLGPAADGLVHAVRQAVTVRDLLDVITTAQRAIANTCGRAQADEFASRYIGVVDD